MELSENDTLALETASLTMNLAVAQEREAAPTSDVMAVGCPCMCTDTASCYKESEWTYLPALDTDKQPTLADPDYPFEDDSGDGTVECFGLAKRKFVVLVRKFHGNLVCLTI
jgi:hypothetical protein